MALPILLGLGAAGLFGLTMNSVDNNNERAERLNAKAFNRMGEAKKSLMLQGEKTQKALTKLANRKKGIMASGMKRFVELYEKLIKIELTEHDDGLDSLLKSLDADDLPSMKQMVAVSGRAMTDKELVVTMLCSFKYGGILGSILKDSEIDVQIASLRKKQANAIASQSENEEIVLKGIYDQAEAFSELLAKLNFLFLRSIKTSDEIIAQKGNDSSCYTKTDHQYLMTCVNMAKSIKTAIDAPLFDENGEVSGAVKKAMSIGQDCLEKIAEAK